MGNKVSSSSSSGVASLGMAVKEVAETITATATTTNLSSLISNMEAETIAPKEAGTRAEAGRRRRQPSDRECGEEAPLEDVTTGALTTAAVEIRAMETATDLAGAMEEVAVAVAIHETAGALPQRRDREVRRRPPRREVGHQHRRHHRCTVVAVVVDRGVTHRQLQAAAEVATTTRAAATTSPSPRMAAAVLDHRRAKAAAATAATAAAVAAASPTTADERLSLSITCPWCPVHRWPAGVCFAARNEPFL